MFSIPVISTTAAYKTQPPAMHLSEEILYVDDDEECKALLLSYPEFTNLFSKNTPNSENKINLNDYINQKNKNGKTLMHELAGLTRNGKHIYKALKILVHLVLLGGDMNAQDKEGFTFMHYISPNFWGWFFEHGGSESIKNSRGFLPFESRIEIKKEERSYAGHWPIHATPEKVMEALLISNPSLQQRKSDIFKPKRACLFIELQKRYELAKDGLWHKRILQQHPISRSIAYGEKTHENFAKKEAEQENHKQIEVLLFLENSENLIISKNSEGATVLKDPENILIFEENENSTILKTHAGVTITQSGFKDLVFLKNPDGSITLGKYEDYKKNILSLLE